MYKLTVAALFFTLFSCDGSEKLESLKEYKDQFIETKSKELREEYERAIQSTDSLFQESKKGLEKKLDELQIDSLSLETKQSVKEFLNE
ncbi:hypothetical protein [Brumimicrobium oceani]|uniref:Uncharacterized protein n=1 Tax=Brumimicrobium oceani TaxID=2100725 RepID=A0A2U2XC06_9FLAO|nr:hypothetical protein [Brumimicrobium oceani]PWH85336.1 hypothetical protein DIT68_10390 [Brumimicrobium oceani]